MKISKRNKIIKKILGYFSLFLISFLIIFFIWKREFQKEEMEKWVTDNSWEWESGASVCTWSIISLYRNDGLQYEMENLHIQFFDGRGCTVIWAYGNTMIVRDDRPNVKNKYGFYERWRGSDRWHEIW